MRIKIVVFHPVPSLNLLFKMSHWDRTAERRKTQNALLCGLSASAKNCSTQTTLSSNILWTAFDTLASYLTTGKKTSPSKSARKRLPTKKMSAPR